MLAAGKPAPVAARQMVESLNDLDRQQLQRMEQNPDDFDEIIFFELNAGER